MKTRRAQQPGDQFEESPARQLPWSDSSCALTVARAVPLAAIESLEVTAMMVVVLEDWPSSGRFVKGGEDDPSSSTFSDDAGVSEDEVEPCPDAPLVISTDEPVTFSWTARLGVTEGGGTGWV